MSFVASVSYCWTNNRVAGGLRPFNHFYFILSTVVWMTRLYREWTKTQLFSHSVFGFHCFQLFHPLLWNSIISMRDPCTYGPRGSCIKTSWCGVTLIESTKTTSMEDVSTGVLEKIKNIQEVKIKPKNDVMYQDIYNCICQNTKKWRQWSVWWNYWSIPELQLLHRWRLGMDMQFQHTS